MASPAVGLVHVEPELGWYRHRRTRTRTRTRTRDLARLFTERCVLAPRWCGGGRPPRIWRGGGIRLEESGEKRWHPNGSQ